MDNSQALATLGTQDTGQRNKTQKHSTAQKTKKYEQHGPHQKQGVNLGGS